jgi:NADPH:quinone reductase-like Zn-dependent oxidoreductase
MQRFGDSPALALEIGCPGFLESLHFVEDKASGEPLSTGELEIQIKATGVNFRDCLTALGQIDTKLIGGECAGVVTRVGEGCKFKPGDRVCSCLTNTYRKFVRGSSDFVAKIPDEVSFTDGAAMPIAFLTTWHALCDLARLEEGQCVLIHAGAGGTGQAAIQIAKYLGAEIFVTVGSNDKKKLLMEVYGLAEDHILYSRNTSFAQGIMRLTNGRGVDVVLNSLSGESLLASWGCVAPVSSKAGRFDRIRC